MKRILSTILVSVFCFSAFAQGQFPMFNNQTHTPEAQPFADLSRQIWDLMAAKDADSLKDIFHPNAMFVHMGGYWGTDQELEVIGQGFIHYKHAEVYGVEPPQMH